MTIDWMVGCLSTVVGLFIDVEIKQQRRFVNSEDVALK